MATGQRRAAITGLGMFTPVGLDTTSTFDALLRGESGIRPLKIAVGTDLPVQIAGELPGWDGKKYFDKDGRKSLKMMARTVILAVAAANVALESAKFPRDQRTPERFGVEFGSGMIPTELDDVAAASHISVSGHQPVDMLKWGQEGIPTIEPLWMLKYLPNMAACHTSILHDAQGPNNSITETEVASLLAMGEAFSILKRDLADFFIVGGADSKLTPLSLVRQALFMPLSRWAGDPAQACRPFDADRSGLVMAEGGAAVALEDLDHAIKRGAPILAELCGFGSAFDRGLTGRGVARAIRAALTQAGVSASDIDHVNAHGIGTVEGDAWEARGIAEVFGPNGVPVFAAKGSIGNTSAGSGLIELGLTLEAFRRGTLPGTLNFTKPDPACPVQVSAEARPVVKPYAVKLGMTDVGQVAAVVVRRGE